MPITSAPAAANPPPEQPRNIAAELFGASLTTTRGFVNYAEGQVGPGVIKLDTPEGWEGDEAALAERQRVADAMASTGIGPSLAKELFADVAAATAKPVTVSRDAAMAELRGQYGAGLEAKLASVAPLVQQMEAKYPGTVAHLNATGLGNSVQFIQKLVTMAGRNGR